MLIYNIDHKAFLTTNYRITSNSYSSFVKSLLPFSYYKFDDLKKLTANANPQINDERSGNPQLRMKVGFAALATTLGNRVDGIEGFYY